jgi:hypothetical protein
MRLSEKNSVTVLNVSLSLITQSLARYARDYHNHMLGSRVLAGEEIGTQADMALLSCDLCAMLRPAQEVRSKRPHPLPPQ